MKNNPLCHKMPVAVSNRVKVRYIIPVAVEGLRRGSRSSNAVMRKVPLKISHCHAERWGIFSNHSHSNQPK